MDFESAQKITEVLKAVAHPVRLQIVAALEDKALCVADIMAVVGGKQAITSQQLNMMRTRGVLEARREGNKVFYSIANPNVIKLLDCMFHHCDRAKTS
jgi:DNA-binding transcriptional ArsR family regulator